MQFSFQLPLWCCDLKCLCVLTLHRAFSRDVILIISANNVKDIQTWLLRVLLWRYYMSHTKHMQVHLTPKHCLDRDWEQICKYESVNRMIIISNQHHMHGVWSCTIQNTNFMKLLVPCVHVKCKYMVKWNV